MDLKSNYELYKLLEKDHIGLIYHGVFTNQVLGMATDLIKKHLDGEKGLTGLRNKLSFLMVESFQNIVRYADSTDDLDTFGHEIFVTRNIDEAFYVASANLVENNKIEYIRSKLDQVNTLDESELKKLYVNVLTNKKLSSKGGAGLGFIEMVRKTKEKLDFDFVKYNDDFSFFYYLVKLKANENEEYTPGHASIHDIKSIHELVKKNRIMMVHKGNFSQEAIKPVLLMVEDNIKDHVLSTQKRIFHMLVELLQNISKHAYQENGTRQGIFTLCNINNHFEMSAGNFVDNNSVELLESILTSLSKKSKSELNDYYKKVLRDGHENQSLSSGLGLIDLARESSTPIEYYIERVDDKKSFYSLIIKQKCN